MSDPAEIIVKLRESQKAKGQSLHSV